jgi:Transposase DDE domain
LRNCAAALAWSHFFAQVRGGGIGLAVVDNEDGIVLDHRVEPGNPADAPQLVPAIERVIGRTGRAPRTVTADRGYGEKRVDGALHHLGVRIAVIPREGRPGIAVRPKNIEKRSAATSMATRSEGRISYLKRATAGTAPASTVPKVPGSGPGTASWPTTWSRSAHRPADTAELPETDTPNNNADKRHRQPISPRVTFSGRSG